MASFSDLTHLSLHPLDLAFRALAVYIAVLLLLRVSGKRQIGQTSPTEFVAILLISNAVQNSMNGGDNSLVGGLLLAGVLIAASWTISVLTYRNRLVRHFFEGAPTLLVHNGRSIEAHLSRERVTHEDLMAMLRGQGVHHLNEVHSAVLESNGSLSIIRVVDLKA